MKYFIQIDGEPTEPLTADQIRLRVSQRGLHGSDLIRREDEPPSQWHPLRSMEEFADLSEALRPAGNPWAGLSLLLVLISMMQFFWSMLRNGPPWFCIPAVGAIICGHLSSWRIKKNYHRDVNGHAMTKAGLWCGYLVLGIPALLVTSASWIGYGPSENGSLARTVNNCRQITTVLRIYSSDYGGAYPDSLGTYFNTSNEVFRECFKADAVDNEMIFGCPMSPFQPDGKIGSKPDFAEALKPGENHWAFTKGTADTQSGEIPLAYENVAETTWPPKWNAKLAGQAKPGRTWANGRIVVGFNDLSVEVIQLDITDPEHAVPRQKGGRKPVFPTEGVPSGIKVLNPAR